MMTLRDGQDADAGRIEEILRGARRGPRDPDLALSLMLSELKEPEDQAAIESVLERLARDARPD